VRTHGAQKQALQFAPQNCLSSKGVFNTGKPNFSATAFVAFEMMQGVILSRQQHRAQQGNIDAQHIIGHKAPTLNSSSSPIKSAMPQIMHGQQYILKCAK